MNKTLLIILLIFPLVLTGCFFNQTKLTNYNTNVNNQADRDSDNDGLADIDEINKWNTDPNNPDTDGDGYSDSEEVNNSYNPLGAGKLGEEDFLEADEAYLDMKLEFYDIETMDELMAYMRKYGSRQLISQYESEADEYDNLSEELQLSLLGMFLNTSPAYNDIYSVKDDIRTQKTGNRVALFINISKKKITGEIDMVLEDNEWKLDKETWLKN